MTNQIVHKKIIDDQCIFYVYFYMLTHSSSALFVKGATTRSFSSSAFCYSALLLSHSISPTLRPIRSTHTHTHSISPSTPSPVLPRRPSSDMRRRHLLLLAGLGTSLLLRPPSSRRWPAPPRSAFLLRPPSTRRRLAPPRSIFLLRPTLFSLLESPLLLPPPCYILI